MNGGTMTPTGGGQGLALRITGQPTSGSTSDTGGFKLDPAAVDLSQQFTLLFVGAPSSFQTNSVAITGQINAYQEAGVDAPTMRWGPGLNIPNAKRLRGFANIGGTDRTIDDSVDSVEGTIYVNILTYNGEEMSLWSNGRLVGAITCSGAVRVSAYTALTIINDYQNISLDRDGFGARGFMGDFYLAGASSRGLTRAQVASLGRNPWQLFEQPARPLWAPSIAAAVYRLISDTTLNGWTAVNAASVAAATNEAVPSDAEWGQSPNLTSSYTGAINSQPAGTYTVTFRGDRTLSQGQVRIRYLDAGNADVGGTAWQALTGTITTYTLTATTSATATQARIEVQP